MNFAGTSISEIAGAMGRTWRNMRSNDAIADTAFDPYSAAPALRTDIQDFLSVEIESEVAVEDTPEEQALRASEKLEHDTMCLIRGALYPVDQT